VPLSCGGKKGLPVVLKALIFEAGGQIGRKKKRGGEHSQPTLERGRKDRQAPLHWPCTTSYARKSAAPLRKEKEGALTLGKEGRNYINTATTMKPLEGRRKNSRTAEGKGKKREGRNGRKESYSVLTRLSIPPTKGKEGGGEEGILPVIR